MKPLQAMGFGFVFLLLDVPVARISPDGPGFDLYPDPIAWLLILVGLSRLPQRAPQLKVQRGFGLIALTVSVVLYFPGVKQGMLDADPTQALAWATEIPRFAFIALLCWSLTQLAATEDEPGAAGWFRTTMTLAFIAGLFPVFALGGDLDWLGAIAGATALLSITGVLILTFVYSGREWAGAPPPEVQYPTQG